MVSRHQKAGVFSLNASIAALTNGTARLQTPGIKAANNVISVFVIPTSSLFLTPPIIATLTTMQPDCIHFDA